MATAARASDKDSRCCPCTEPEKAIFPLTPAQSKRLIARAVAALPEVSRAMREGLVVVANGTTNAYVAEELSQARGTLDKVRYAVGLVTGDRLAEVPLMRRMLPYVFDRGQQVPMVVREGKVVDLRDGTPMDSPLGYFVSRFKRGDVLVKGANAVDPSGKVGVLMGNEMGGSVGMTVGAIYARGCHLVVPVGLEKLVPSVEEAAAVCGQLTWTYSVGSSVGMMPLANAMVVTELEALERLAGLRAVHVASGGVLGGEGCVVIGVAGSADQMESCMRLVRELKTEPPISFPEEVVSPSQKLPEWW